MASDWLACVIHAAKQTAVILENGFGQMTILTASFGRNVILRVGTFPGFTEVWAGIDNHIHCILSQNGDVIMTTIASQITSLTVVYSIVYSDADQRKHQSSASLAFVWGIHRDRWIPRTKGQLRGKCFHLMTSSWNVITRLCPDFKSLNLEHGSVITYHIKQWI